MSNTFRAAVLVAVASTATCLSADAAAAVTVIQGGVLIDGTGAAPLQDAVIVIDDGRIVDIWKRGEKPVPAAAAVIPAEGKYIIPGLADAHVHYTGWMPELYLHYGVTTALVANRGETRWVQAQRRGIAKGKIPGPRLLLLGTGGGSAPPEFPIGTDPPVKNETQARENVRNAVKYDVDGIKIHVGIGADLLRAFVDEASKAGLAVHGHLGKVDAREAALAGIRGIAHLSGVAIAMMTPEDLKVAKTWRPVYARFQVADPRYFRGPDPRHVMMFSLRRRELQEDLIKTLVARNVYLDCDLVHVVRGATERRDAYVADDFRLLSDPQLDYIPAEFRQKHQLDYSMFERLTLEETDRLRDGYRKLQEFVRAFVRAGGKVLAGTDAGSVAALPGIGTHRTLELLVDAGLTPAEALAAATTNLAQFAGRGWPERIGTIRKGGFADLVILDEDPLKDIRNTRKIHLVMKDGQPVDRAFHAGFRNPLADPRDLSRDARANPEPSVRSIDPGLVVEQSGGFRLRVRGSDFVETTLVRINGTALPTEFVGESELLASVPAELIENAGTYLVTAYTPQGGGESRPAALIVEFR